MPDVSILMPACNVEKFLRECMDSVVNQTLKDIEIICLDDGSKDSTGEILDKYAAKDSRIKVIHKPNSGYGHSMNVGLKNATGEYIGIVETDDFTEPDMFEKLYETAKKGRLDMVKSNYYAYVSTPEPANTYMEVLKDFHLYNKVFLPCDHPDVFRVRPCIWSGLYRREFLLENNIWFTETPGASYQDTAFAFKVWASSQRAALIKEAYLHYRTDNANSSVKSAAKVYCLCDEYASIETFLDERPELKEKLQKLEISLKYESYRWNLARLTQEFKHEFLLRMNQEFTKAKTEGVLSKRFFSDYAWKNVNWIIDDMEDYYLKRCSDKPEAAEINKTEINNITETAKPQEAKSQEPPYEKMISPKVSVILAIYNAAEFLEECLDSVLNQTLKDIEVICVNDGSPDNSLEILKQYEKKDSRIKIISQPNQGAGSARNTGMAAAKGEYLSFLDADDFFEPDMLEAAYNTAHSTGADVCVFDADLFNHTTKKYNKCTWAFRRQFFPEENPFSPQTDNIRENIFRMFNGWAWDKLFRREYVQGIGLQFQNLRTTNDMFFVFIGLSRAEKIVTLDKVLAHQRVDVNTSLSRTREKSWNCFYSALLAMQEELKNQGLYECYERAFVNWALNFSLWQFKTMKGEPFGWTYNLLKKEGFEQLDITRHHRDYFYNPKEYEQFLRMYTTPLENYKNE